MASKNPYLKPLQAFSADKDLVVDETFRLKDEAAGADPLAELQRENATPPGEIGKETVSFKTNGPVEAGLLGGTSEGGNYLLAVSQKGLLYIFSENNGQLEVSGKVQLTRPITSAPILDRDVLYSVSRSGVIQAARIPLPPASDDGLDGEPEVLWQKTMPKGILSRPFHTGKMLLVAALDGLYSFEAYYQGPDQYSIGNLLWQYPLAGCVSSPLMDRGLIFVGSEDQKIYCLEYGGNKARVFWEYETRGPVRGKPIITRNGNFLVFGSQDGNVYCLERKSGKLVWPKFVGDAVNGSIVSRAEGHKEFFYFGSDNGNFYCLDGQGKIHWEYHTHGRIRGEALVSGDRVYFGSEDNQFYCLDAHSGEVIFQYGTDGNINGPAVILGGTIYFGSTDSFVYGVRV